MDIVRTISKTSFDKFHKFAEVECNNLVILTATHCDGQDINIRRQLHVNEEHLLQHISTIGATQARPEASLTLVFLPQRTGGGINTRKSTFKELIDYLQIDPSILQYIVSSRSGWYCARGDEDRCSFLLKDYMYMLAWSFNPKTMETRAMVSARSDFEARSAFKDSDGNFYLPDLCRSHLYHPLSLAFYGLADYMIYFEDLLVSEGYKVGEIEKDTGYGLWVNLHNKKKEDQKEANQPPVDRKNMDKKADKQRKKLTPASQKIARVIGIFVNMSKSLETAEALTLTIRDSSTWRCWVKKHGNEHPKQSDEFDWCAHQFDDGIFLLSRRIETFKQSGLATVERAKAQFKVIMALISREDANNSLELAKATQRESGDMKVIAMMTMAFLPATFFAALFAVPSLNFDPDKANMPIITNNFWIYWAFTVPTTFLVFVCWDVLNHNGMLRQAWKKRPELKWPPMRDTFLLIMGRQKMLPDAGDVERSGGSSPSMEMMDNPRKALGQRHTSYNPS